MDLKPFIKTAITDIVEAIEETEKTLGRRIFVETQGDNKSVEFDIATTAENSTNKDIDGSIKVLSLGLIGGKYSTDFKQATVTRIKFRTSISPKTFEQEKEQRSELEKRGRR